MVLSMCRWKGKVAVVTGASTGIGSAIVRQLVEAGLKVVGLARRKDRLDKLEKELCGKCGKLYPYKADVTNECDMLDAFEFVKEEVGSVHILVNNAGVLRPTTLADGETKLWKEVLDTNILGLCIGTREALKCMRECKIDDGHIIHINSILGHKVGNFPNQNVYPATKWAVTALTETLRQELITLKSRIRVTSVSPGLVATDIFLAGDKGHTKQMEGFLQTSPILNPEDIADAVTYVLSTPPHVQVHEIMVKPIGEVI